jgi:hypothetical protein
MNNQLYTISDNLGIPIFMRVNFDALPDHPNPPKSGDVFLNIFTEPWIAYEYLKTEGKLHEDPKIMILDKDEDWSHIKYIAKEEGFERVMINGCNTQSPEHERLFSVGNVDDISDFEELLKLSRGVTLCKTCFNKERFIKENDMEKSFNIIRWGEAKNQDVETLLDETIDLVYSAERAMPAHFCGYKSRGQSLCIDSDLIDEESDYAMSSQAWGVLGDFNLGIDNHGEKIKNSKVCKFMVLRLGEDIMATSFLMSEKPKRIIQILLSKK